MNQIKTIEKKTITHFSTFGLALFLFLTPFEYPLADLVAISPLRIVGLFAMGLAVIDILIQRIPKIDYRIVCVIFWLLYGLITYLWAIDKTRWQSYYSIYLNNALMFILFSMISFTKREADMLKKSMILGVGALLLYMTFVPNAVVYSDYQNRLTLNAGEDGLDQNYLAALMLISFGIVFYNLCNVKQRKIYKILSIVFCIAIVYYIILTGSRSGLIALLLIVLLSINTSWKTRLSIGIPIVVLILIILPIVARHIPQELLERFSLQAISGQEAESETRLVIWERALSSLQGIELLFGYGAGSSQTIIGNALSNGKDMAIHNHYIAMLVEFGIIGFIFINMPILKMTKKMWKNDKYMAISFIAILLMAFFLDVVTTKFFWSAMILVSVCCSCCDGKSYNELQGA